MAKLWMDDDQYPPQPARTDRTHRQHDADYRAFYAIVAIILILLALATLSIATHLAAGENVSVPLVTESSTPAAPSLPLAEVWGDTQPTPPPLPAVTRDSGASTTSASASVPYPWSALADCESGEWDRHGNPIPNTRRWSWTDGFWEGGLSFHPDTWDWLAPDDFPDDADLATKWQQVFVAERVRDIQGFDAFPVCAKKLGLIP